MSEHSTMNSTTPIINQLFTSLDEEQDLLTLHILISELKKRYPDKEFNPFCVNAYITFPTIPITSYNIADSSYSVIRSNVASNDHYIMTKINEFDKIYYYDNFENLVSFDIHMYVFFSGNNSYHMFIESTDMPKQREFKKIVFGMKSDLITSRIDDKIFSPECQIVCQNLCRFFSKEAIDAICKCGYPSQYGLILVGIPGSGKSMFVRYLHNKICEANKYVEDDDFYDDEPILVGVSDKPIQDNSIPVQREKAFPLQFYSPGDIRSYAERSIDLNSSGVLVFDDIDSLFEEKAAGAQNDYILSWMLTQTDVTTSSSVNRLLVLVANTIERIEPALIRPGRFDSIIKFESIVEDQFKAMLKFVTKHDKNVTEEYLNHLYSDVILKHKNNETSLANLALAGRLFYSGLCPTWEAALMTALLKKEEGFVRKKTKTAGF